MSVFENEILPQAEYVRNIAVKMTGSPADADDLIQEALLKAYQNIDKYTPGTRASKWLYVIALNLWRNKMGAFQRRKGILEANPSEMEEAYFPDVEEYVGPAFHPEVVRALEDLPAEFVQPLLMSTFMDLEKREVGARLGVPHGTVMSRCHRARLYLQKVLRNYAWKEYGIQHQPR